MVLERRGDCSLILARVYGGEREKRKREKEEEKRKKRIRRKSRFGSLELWFGNCMEFMFGLLVWKYHKSLLV